MLRVPRLVVLLVAVAVAGLGIANAATSAQSDAGSGADAGDALEDSLRIPGFGTYRGNLTGTDVSDWYKWKLGSRLREPTCVEAGVDTGAAVGARLVSVDQDRAREMKANVLLTRTTWMGLASPGFTGGFLQVGADALGTTLPYGFGLKSLRASELPPGDAGSGADAPSSIAGALAAPGPCFGGRLDPAAGDAMDVFALGAALGDRVTLSLSDPSGVVSLRVLDGGGKVLATLLSGDVATISIPASGTYYASASTTDGLALPYMVGVCEPDCGPPQRPCHPMCIDIIKAM